jgi:O-antigen ligase
MPENIHLTPDGRTLDPRSAWRTEWVVPVILGLIAGVAAAKFVLDHWSLALVAILLVFALSFSENETFLLAIIFLVPVAFTRRIGAINDITTPLRLLVVCGFFAGRFWRGELRFRKLLSPPVSKVCAVLLIIAPLSVLMGPIGWRHHSMSQNYELVSWVAFFFFILAWVDTRKRLEKIVVTMLFSLCLVGAFAIIQIAADGYTKLELFLQPPGPDFNPWSGRSGSFLGYATDLAGYLDLALPFALAAAVVCRGPLKKLGTLAFALGVAGLGCSQSLGGLITLAFTLGLGIRYFVQSRRNKIALASALVLLGAVFFAVRHVLNPSHFASTELTMPTDVIIRFLYFHAAWVMFRSHPLLGIGLGNFVTASPSLVPNAEWMGIGATNLSASSVYLSFLAETGLAGTLAFLYLVLLGLRMARREMKSAAWHLAPVLGFGALGAVWSVLVHGCVDYLFYAQYGTFLYMILGLLLASAVMHARPKPAAARSENKGAPLRANSD